MHASLPEGGRWPDPTSVHDGPRGVVARILEPNTQKPLVVKRLRVGSEEVASVALRLLGVAMVDHPGVGPLRGLRPVEGAVEVVRDDVPRDWSELLAVAPAWAELREHTLAMLDALAAIHAEGWVHGALRPTNVRWSDEGSLMVVDGGWPQEHRAAGHRGVSGDLWDVGALVWGACTGTLPTFGEPLPDFVPREDVPDAVGTLLANLLCDDPLGRYDLAADVATELRALGAAVPASGHDPSPRPGPIAPAVAMTGPIPWRRPTPEALPSSCPTTEEASWRMHQPPLVGRQPTLDALWSAASAAEEGPVVALLVGTRGMGRSRVARRFARELARGGWAAPVWLSHDGDALHDGLLGAVERRYAERPHDDPEAATEYIARRLARARGVILEDVADVAVALRRTLGPTHPGEGVRMDPARRELSRGLNDARWRGRSVLIIDDAHRSTEAWEGLELARTLLRSETPVLVVATLDLDALDDERIAKQVAELEEAGARKMVLKPVRSDDVGVMLRGAPDALAEGSHEGIVQTAAGCPEVVRQLVLTLMELGVRGDDGCLRWPEGLAPTDDWLGPRVQRAAERSGHPRRFLDALHLASLAGDGLPASVIHSFLGPVVVDAAQSGLWSRHLLGMSDEGSWVMSPLVREAMGQRAAARPDVAYLERRLAEAHGRRSEGRALVVAAEHGLRAGDRERAVPRLLRAVERAWSSGRRDGLDLAASVAGSDAAGPEMWLWSVRADPHDEARREAALTALREADGQAAWLAQLLVVEGDRQLQLGRIDEADEAFKEAETLAIKAKLPETEARAIAGKGSVAHHRRNFSGAEVHFTRAVNRMAKADAPRSMARVMMEQGLLARRQGRFREAAELYDEAADGFREADDLVGSARARLGLARVRCQQLDLDAARSWVDVARKAAADLLDRPLSAEAALVDGDVRRLGSDAEGAEASYRGYLSLGDASAPEGRVVAELGLAQLALARDDAHEAYERANGAAAALEHLPHHWLWAPYRLVVAALLADRGDHMQTWQWLWSASELGLGDTVDRDTVALLTRVCNVAKLAGWGNVIRVSANLAVEQLERLGDRDGAERVKQDITGIILK